jgi:periplasmic protein CpxP/Spy
MNIHKFSLVAALALGGLLAGANLSSAQDNNHANGNATPGRARRQPPTVEQRLERLTKALNLTDEQKPKVKAVLEEQTKKFEAMRNDSSLTRDERREKFRTMRQEENKKMKAILTPEQFDNYQQQMRRGGRRGQRNGQTQQTPQGQ